MIIHYASFEPAKVNFRRAPGCLATADIESSAVPGTFNFLSNKGAGAIIPVKCKRIAVVGAEIFYRIEDPANVEDRDPQAINAKDLALTILELIARAERHPPSH